MGFSFFNHAKILVRENNFLLSYHPLNHPKAEKNINFHETCTVLAFCLSTVWPNSSHRLLKEINLRTPEGTPNKNHNPSKLTSSYFSATNYVKQNIRSYLRNVRFLLWNCEEHPVIHRMRFSATIFRQVNPVVSPENPFARSKSRL